MILHYPYTLLQFGPKKLKTLGQDHLILRFNMKSGGKKLKINQDLGMQNKQSICNTLTRSHMTNCGYRRDTPGEKQEEHGTLKDQDVCSSVHQQELVCRSEMVRMGFCFVLFVCFTLFCF